LAEPAVNELVSRDQSIKVRWLAFELRPEPVPHLDPDGDYLVSAWQNHVYPLAEKMNMPLKKPPIQPRSRLAHEAAKCAGEQGCFDEYHLGLFRAFFEHGKDIGDIGILKGLAADLKLDAGSLQNVLQNGDYTEMVLADQKESVQAGVRAVPAFAVNGRVEAAGVQTAERLHEILFRNPFSGVRLD
jgi:predicted DsbA family dithiol-disulfide isomerase